MVMSAEQILDVAPPSIDRVYMTGFMGAGKSTVGALLAARLCWRFIDLDHYIEEKQGAPVPALIETLGESAFRHLELDAVRSVQSATASVISLGGGTLETESVRVLLTGDPGSRLVYLQAPLEHLLERCEAQGGAAKRPLLGSANQDPALIRNRFENRLTHYQKAHLTVATQDLTPEEVAASIYNQMAAFR